MGWNRGVQWVGIEAVEIEGFMGVGKGFRGLE